MQRKQGKSGQIEVYIELIRRFCCFFLQQNRNKIESISIIIYHDPITNYNTQVVRFRLKQLQKKKNPTSSFRSRQMFLYLHLCIYDCTCSVVYTIVKEVCSFLLFFLSAAYLCRYCIQMLFLFRRMLSDVQLFRIVRNKFKHDWSTVFAAWVVVYIRK